MKKLSFLFISFSLFLVPNSTRAQYTIIHIFNDTLGQNPYAGSLSIDGSKWFGMTEQGGSHRFGTIFSIDTNGNNFKVLHNCDTGNNGALPYGSVSCIGKKIYGMTLMGGAKDSGVIYSMDSSGNNYKILHSFRTINNDGGYPYGSLTSLGNKLYGMTVLGGAHNGGIIFSIDTDGSNYTIVHSFGDVAYDGSVSYSSLSLSGNKLFGMTSLGGLNHNGGAIFSMDINGANYTILYNFEATSTDGYNPWYTNLTIAGSKGYGMTSEGGTNARGTIFSIDTNGNNYKTIHNFTLAGNDGYWPIASLSYAGHKLYGMANLGGDAGQGVLFALDTNGANFTEIHSFGMVLGDGVSPRGSLSFANNKWYGMTDIGGPYNDGTIFTIDTSTITSVNYLNPANSNIIACPNPSTGLFTFQLSNTERQTLNMEVYNVLGEKVYSSILPQNPKGALNSIDLSSQPNGIYLYRVLNVDGGLIGEGKLVIQK
ncbi:MAG TPA: choice-of-anchor tandem repeat GloVer-containing protein [Bacteroidia bacterium]|jgi:uncharacterized repeat protein (TIGR03803 family)|nr:choice-of-anchor tandem repeat GloVer-containing protein [Bacteroidia bacterium]